MSQRLVLTISDPYEPAEWQVHYQQTLLLRGMSLAEVSISRPDVVLTLDDFSRNGGTVQVAFAFASSGRLRWMFSGASNTLGRVEDNEEGMEALHRILKPLFEAQIRLDAWEYSGIALADSPVVRRLEVM